MAAPSSCPGCSARRCRSRTGGDIITLASRCPHISDAHVADDDRGGYPHTDRFSALAAVAWPDARSAGRARAARARVLDVGRHIAPVLTVRCRTELEPQRSERSATRHLMTRRSNDATALGPRRHGRKRQPCLTRLGTSSSIFAENPARRPRPVNEAADAPRCSRDRGGRRASQAPPRGRPSRTPLRTLMGCAHRTTPSGRSCGGQGYW